MNPQEDHDRSRRHRFRQELRARIRQAESPEEFEKRAAEAFESFLSRDELRPEHVEEAQMWLPWLRRAATGKALLVVALPVAFAVGVLFFVSGSLLPEGVVAEGLRELGIALWTSVFVVLFLELGVDALKWVDRVFVKAVERKVAEHEGKLPTDPSTDEVHAATAKLDLILSRLDDIETRLSAP
jgi:hypothetical protein